MCAQSSCDSILTTRSTHSEHYARFGTSNNLKNSENIVPSSKPRQMCIIDIARTEEVTLNLLAIIGHQNYVSKTTDNNCENLQAFAAVPCTNKITHQLCAQPKICLKTSKQLKIEISLQTNWARIAQRWYTRTNKQQINNKYTELRCTFL